MPIFLDVWSQNVLTIMVQQLSNRWLPKEPAELTYRPFDRTHSRLSSPKVQCCWTPVHRWRASSLLPPHNLHTSLLPPPPSKFTPVSEKFVVPSGEVDHMAQIVAIEPSNKMCRHIFNCREPDLCLLTSCQLCPPKLPFVVPPLLKCIFNCLLAQWGSVGLDQGPVHPYPPCLAAEKWSNQLLLLDTRTLLPVFSANLDIAKRRALELESLIKGCLREDGLWWERIITLTPPPPSTRWYRAPKIVSNPLYKNSVFDQQLCTVVKPCPSGDTSQRETWTWLSGPGVQYTAEHFLLNNSL